MGRLDDEVLHQVETSWMTRVSRAGHVKTRARSDNCNTKKKCVMCADRSQKRLVSALTGLGRHNGEKQCQLCDW